jgi:hypothetical protein
MRLAALLVLIAVAPASAQEMPREHKIGLALYATAATLDYHSTYRAMSLGIKEQNPMGRITEGKPAATVLVGASVDAVVTPLLYKWLGKKHPKLTTVLLFTAASFRAHLAAGNYQAAGMMRQ